MIRLIEKSEYFASGLPLTGLVMIAYSIGCSKYNMTESTGGEDILHPLLNVLNSYVESRGDNTALVDAADKGNYDFAGAMVI